jgi:xanthine dehydrogenase accessory factor
MKEIRDIIKAYQEAQQSGRRTALATVVHVEGSSYRQPGARMLITEDGMLTGAISGGCLEGDALRKALLVITRQKPMLVTYDTSDEDDAKLGVGLGCNGIIQVLIEPVDAAEASNPIQLLKKITNRRQQVVLITLFSMQNRKEEQPGTCLLVEEDGSFAGKARDESLQKSLLADAKYGFSGQQSVFKNYTLNDSTFTAFIELIQPPVHLVIVGAGNDAMPLVEMAAILGWEITLVDGRVSHAKKERFPKANNIVIAKPEKAVSQITPDEQTVFVLLTHNYVYDMAMVRQLLAVNTIYTGVLGPRKKMERIYSELEQEGIAISDAQKARIYGPVGLDIGAETAEEIALAIVAEIKAVFSARKGGLLRDSRETIHKRQDTI